MPCSRCYSCIMCCWYASAMLDICEDLINFKDVVGHASVTTTQQYDRLSEERMR